MGKLKEWKSIEEKREYFEYTKINTDEELDRFVDKPWNGFYFRGLNGARFRLYSSVQRTWIEQGLSKRFCYDINAFVQREIETAREKLYPYKGLFHGLNDVEVLCFLQHYGAPTALIDFTLNLNAALYFASSGAALKGGDNEIDEYISVYGVEKNNGQLIDENQFVNLTIEKLKKLNEEFGGKETSIDERIELYRNLNYGNIVKLGELQNIDSHYCYTNVKISRLVCVNDWENLEFLSNYRTNANVIAQKGLFVVSKDEQPMDEIFVREDYVKNDLEWDQRRLGYNLKYGLMHCWDIHKSLIPRILDKIGDECNKASLFPDNYQIAKDVFNDVMK